MISEYCNQTVSHKAKTGVNDYNEPTYAEAVNIKARVEYAHKMTRDRYGQEVTSTTQVYTETAVGLDDVLTIDNIDRPAIMVKKTPDLDGNICFYEVML